MQDMQVWIFKSDSRHFSQVVWEVLPLAYISRRLQRFCVARWLDYRRVVKQMTYFECVYMDKMHVTLSQYALILHSVDAHHKLSQWLPQTLLPK